MIKWPEIYEKITKKNLNKKTMKGKCTRLFYFAIPIIVLHFDIISLDKTV